MILLLSTSDTDLLSARAVIQADPRVSYHWANPARLLGDDLPQLADSTDVVIIRLLGDRRVWESGIDYFVNPGIPTILVSSGQTPDTELAEHSTVPANAATQAYIYLTGGDTKNLTQLHNSLSDTLLLTGLGFKESIYMPAWGFLKHSSKVAKEDSHDTVGIIYYRAQHLAGNTHYTEVLANAVEARGYVTKPIFATSLRAASNESLAEMTSCGALITTVLTASGNRPTFTQAGQDDSGWDVTAFADLNIPIIQGLALTFSRAAWKDSDGGLLSLDIVIQVAVPESDGHIISVTFSFKEANSDEPISHALDLERYDRFAGITTRYTTLRHIDNTDKRVAVMLSVYPTKHARIGNTVSLDTPAPMLKVLYVLADAGYNLGDTTRIPGCATAEGDADEPDAFTHTITGAGGQDPDWLTEEVMEAAKLRLPAAIYETFFAALPEELRSDMQDKRGVVPGALYVHPNTQGIYVVGLTFDNVVVMVQSLRDFGDNPVDIYHDPDLSPMHYYLVCYRFLSLPQAQGGLGADATAHMGKHGNLEWLPGKTVGLSAPCGPDAAIDELSMIYLFLVNDPGKGTQTKRRAHATLVDHPIPPMVRAESYGGITRLGQLLDGHQDIPAMDPTKLSVICREIWTLLTAAKMDRGPSWDERPDEEVFDDMLMHVDGWFYEIKDVAIRGSLHVLSQAPKNESLTGTVITMPCARQLWGGKQTLPGLREALGLVEDSTDKHHTANSIDTLAMALVTAVVKNPDQPIAQIATDVLGPEELASIAGVNGLDQVVEPLQFTHDEILLRLAATGEEILHIFPTLDDGFVPAGPPSSSLRGLVNVLPTARSFYSIDSRVVPSRLAWEADVSFVDGLIKCYRADRGEYPKSVGLSVWGTSAMCASDDNIVKVLALIGVHPVWDDVSRYIASLEPIPLEELGRPRIDVIIRIPDFFRNMLPYVIDLLDDAFQLVVKPDESDEDSYVHAHARADQQGRPCHIFGSKPGTYGVDLLQLIDSGSWRDDVDLARVYTTWGGYAYGRDVDGEEAASNMKTAYRRIQVTTKNADTRKYDIADSDDYFQFHGGVIATIHALTGSAPEAYVDDLTRPGAVRTRILHEETQRVLRVCIVNPQWMQAMRNYGYRGAFKMAATADHLFGYDATTQVMDGWIYETLTNEYAANPENREFFEQSNPWALYDTSECLMEAAERSTWENSDQERMNLLRQTYLDAEDDLGERADRQVNDS